MSVVHAMKTRQELGFSEYLPYRTLVTEKVVASCQALAALCAQALEESGLPAHGVQLVIVPACPPARE